MDIEIPLDVVNVLDASFSHGPAEIYEPVQTLHFWAEEGRWYIEAEDGELYEVQEIYCNVPSASRIDPKAIRPIDVCMVATGRLTISSGVAYVDVG